MERAANMNREAGKKRTEIVTIVKTSEDRKIWLMKNELNYSLISHRKNQS
jgi:hypothetical protein